jgi:hypothetical protein
VTRPQRRHAPVHTEPPGDAVDLFLELSIILTGIEEHVLRGTGMLQTYYDELLRIIGAREAGTLLSKFEPIARRAHSTSDPSKFDPTKFDHCTFKKEVLDDAGFCPVVRSVMTLWYLGMWMQLPREWRDEHGATSYDTDHVVSAAAYRESLVWPAAGAHPMSAKAPGFGTWADPSRLPPKSGTESGS